MRNIGIVLVCLLAIGCSPRKHKDRVYMGTDGHLYTRSHSTNDNAFYWWVYVDSSELNGRTSGSWTRIPSEPTTTLLPTKLVVLEEDEEPTNESTESETATVDEATTEAGVDAADASSGGGEAGDGGASGGDAGGGGDGGGE